MRGVNVRYLGVLCALLSSPRARLTCLCEMVARALKWTLRLALAELSSTLRMPLEVPYLDRLRALLNQFFHYDARVATPLWETRVWPQLLRAFGSDVDVRSLGLGTAAPRESPWSDAAVARVALWSYERGRGVALLFQRVHAMLGFSVRPAYEQLLYARYFSAEAALAVSESSEFSALSPCELLPRLALTELGARVKHVHLLDHAQGDQYKRLARLERDAATQRTLLHLAQTHFARALDALPSHALSLRNAAAVALELLQLDAVALRLSDPRVRHVESLLQAACAAGRGRGDTHSHYQLAYLYALCGCFDAAEDALLASLRADPVHGAAVALYRTLLQRAHLHDEERAFATLLGL